MICEIKLSPKVTGMNNGEREDGLNILTESPTLIREQGAIRLLDKEDRPRPCDCGEWNGGSVSQPGGPNPNYFTSRHI